MLFVFYVIICLFLAGLIISVIGSLIFGAVIYVFALLQDVGKTAMILFAIGLVIMTILLIRAIFAYWDTIFFSMSHFVRMIATFITGYTP